jgi:hypothetical protein
MKQDNDSKEDRERPVLLTELMRLIGKCEAVYQQKRVFNRVLGLVMGELFSFGRHTITPAILIVDFTRCSLANLPHRWK